MNDLFGRNIDYLRLSVTDLCDLRCVYCMDPAGVEKLAHGDILSFEALEELVRCAVALGVTKVRLTGGEPLTRRGIVTLCARLKAIPGVKELAMTTNAQTLERFARPLREAGLDRLNVSLDTLDPDQYRRLTRGGELERVLRGIEAAEAAGFPPVKLNAVLLGGVNDDQIRPLAELAQQSPRSVRFIELMPIGVCARFDPARFVSADCVLERLPELRPLDRDGVALRYTAPGWAGTVGLIRPMTDHFCPACSRIRITSRGFLKPCLHDAAEIPLRGLHGQALKEAMQQAILCKPRQHHLGPDVPSRAGRAMYEIGG